MIFFWGLRRIKYQEPYKLSPFRPSLIVLLFHFIVRIVAQHLHGISLNPYFAPKERLTTDVDIGSISPREIASADVCVTKNHYLSL